VKKGVIIVGIETDMVVVEVETTHDGVIPKLHGQVDDTVAVGVDYKKEENKLGRLVGGTG